MPDHDRAIHRVNFDARLPLAAVLGRRADHRREGFLFCGQVTGLIGFSSDWYDFVLLLFVLLEHAPQLLEQALVLFVGAAHKQQLGDRRAWFARARLGARSGQHSPEEDREKNTNNTCWCVHDPRVAEVLPPLQLVASDLVV